MKLFPAFYPLDDKRVVVAGGGALAARKARLIWGEAVNLVCIAPAFDADFAAEWTGRAALIEADPVGADFKNAALIVIAEEDEVRARRLAKLARDFGDGAPVNVVDQPSLSDFYTPSIVDRGDVVVAISTGGAAPVLGRAVRAQIEQLLPKNIGRLAAFAREFRTAVAGAIEPKNRRQFWERFFKGPIAARFLNGDEAGARDAMLKAVNNNEPLCEDGVVHIVGAGPGDPELLTLRAHRLLQEADVIVYDKLVSEDVLALARRDADRIYVGKSKANHSMEQGDIGALLVRLAREGKNVVRLKGGDPFVFGRGGEELDFLQAAGVEAQVTPGITAATGCAASAGMALTHRDHAQAVTFVTGHAKGDRDPDLDWSALASLGATLVFYMGISKADAIARQLIDNGADPETPIAIIENGSCPDERVIKGALKSLGGLVSLHGVAGPALLVVGSVAQLAISRELIDRGQERRFA